MPEVIILFFTTLVGGLLFFAFPSLSTSRFQQLLLLSGSYLFSITLIHLMPEIFEEAKKIHLHHIGEFLLAGFFLQVFLGLIGGCVAHGHTCNSTVRYSSYSLFFALGIHAILDGFLLKEASLGTWIAMILHKLPASFSLAMLLHKSNWPKQKLLGALIIFSAATPLGFFIHKYLGTSDIIPETFLLILNALAVGSLFHIASMILFEAGPEHQANKSKWVLLLLGATFAVASQHLIPHTHQ